MSHLHSSAGKGKCEIDLWSGTVGSDQENKATITGGENEVPPNGPGYNLLYRLKRLSVLGRL